MEEKMLTPEEQGRKAMELAKQEDKSIIFQNTAPKHNNALLQKITNDLIESQVKAGKLVKIN